MLFYFKNDIIFAIVTSKCIIMNFRVKEILKDRGMTMEQFSGVLGITRITLTRNLNGNPTIETLEKIAIALDVPVSELFEQPKQGAFTCPKCGAVLEVKEREY